MYNRIKSVDTNTQYDYGCVMIDVEMNFMPQIQSYIRTSDLYFGDDVLKFGFEKDPHVTLLYGLEKEVGLDEVKPHIDEIRTETIRIEGLSYFEQPEYDVLKYDVGGGELYFYNVLLKQLPHKPSGYSYSPHLTIAYLQKGLGKTYVDIIPDLKGSLKISNISFSTPLGKKYYFYK